MVAKTQLVWKPSKQKVDMSKIINPLAKTKVELDKKTVVDLTSELQSDKKCKNVVSFLKANDVHFDIKRIPRFENRKLSDFVVYEEVQRLLDRVHCANILTKFDPRLLSPIYVALITGTKDLRVFDSMHTLSIVALLAKEGFWSSTDSVTGEKIIFDREKWLDFEYPCWIIETDQENFPLLAALYRNGEGSKPWDVFDYHRVFVRSERLYGDPGPNGKYKIATQKQAICERENSIPLPPNDPQIGMAGTLSHIKALSLYNEDTMDEFEFVISTNNKYWNGSPVDAQAFGFYGNLYQGFKLMNVPTSGKAFDNFMKEIHAIIKKFFVGLPELRNTTADTYKVWSKIQNKQGKTPPFNCALSIVLKIYKRLGGKHLVTSDANLFVYSPAPGVVHDIYDSLPLSIRQNVNNYTL